MKIIQVIEIDMILRKIDPPIRPLTSSLICIKIPLRFLIPLNLIFLSGYGGFQ
jgi:hypothetical protein